MSSTPQLVRAADDGKRPLRRLRVAVAKHKGEVWGGALGIGFGTVDLRATTEPLRLLFRSLKVLFRS